MEDLSDSPLCKPTFLVKINKYLKKNIKQWIVASFCGSNGRGWKDLVLIITAQQTHDDILTIFLFSSTGHTEQLWFNGERELHKVCSTSGCRAN